MPLRFTKRVVSCETFESCGVFDRQRRRILDIVSGEFWYEGPSFQKRYFIGKVGRYNEYYDDSQPLPMDINGSGRWTS